jgi:AAA family ATP:ADP antiporter
MSYNRVGSDVSEHSDRRNPLERFLGIFTEVRAGEGGLTLAMSFLVFLLLAAYYLMRPVREALILQQGGAEAKAYLSAVMAVLLYFLVQGYARMVSRYERTRLITVVTFIFVGCLVVFWILSRLGVPYLGYAFFVWVGIFSVMVVAQFWSYANDVYSNEAGKRLFPLVGFGGMLGAFVGADISDRLMDFINVYEMLLIAAVILVGCIVITNLISLKVWGRQQIRVGQQSLEAWLGERKERKEREKLAFGVLKEHKYLWYIAMLILVLNLVNTTGEYILGRMVEGFGAEQVELAVSEAKAAGTSLRWEDRELGPPDSPEARDEFVQSTIGKFYAGFFRWMNLLGMFLQLFVVGRLVQYGGIRAGLYWLPIIALGTYGLVFMLPILKYVRIGKIFENASDYSINKTTVQMLFLPTSRDIKYKAKQVTDSFFQRVGDVASALLVFVGTMILHLDVRGFAFVNILFIVGWFFIVRGIVSEHREIEAGNRPELTGEEEEPLAA